MKKKYNIKQTIEGCLKNEPLYQRSLVDQYSGMLLTICHRYLKSSEDARDGLQESLMRIFQNLEKFDSRLASFETWITTITIRLCLTKLDKKQISIVSSDDLPYSHPSFEMEAELLDSYDAMYLTNMIAALPDGYKSVFNLAAIDGYSHKEIAKLLDISVITSRVRLNRAKKILMEKVLALKTTEAWVNTI